MTVAEWIAIAVALLGVAGGIWAQVYQFRKDAQRIDSVNQVANTIKHDTTKMEPAVERIEGTTNKMEEQMLGTILPQLSNFKDKLGRLEGGINVVVKKVEVEKEIQNRVSATIENPDYIKGAVDSIYNENARLNIEIRNVTEQNKILNFENIKLKQENQKLRERLQERENEFKAEISDSEFEYSDIDDEEQELS